MLHHLSKIITYYNKLTFTPNLLSSSKEQNIQPIDDVITTYITDPNIITSPDHINYQNQLINALITDDINKYHFINSDNICCESSRDTNYIEIDHNLSDVHYTLHSVDPEFIGYITTSNQKEGNLPDNNYHVNIRQELDNNKESNDDSINVESDDEFINTNLITQKSNVELTSQKSDETPTSQELDKELTSQELDENLILEELTYQKLDGEPISQESDEDLNYQESDENLTLQDSDENSTLQESDENLTPQESDKNPTLQESDENLTLQESDDNLTLQDSDEESTSQESDDEPTHQESDENSTSQESDEAPISQEIDEELTSQESNDELTSQGSDNNIEKLYELLNNNIKEVENNIEDLCKLLNNNSEEDNSREVFDEQINRNLNEIIIELNKIKNTNEEVEYKKKDTNILNLEDNWTMFDLMLSDLVNQIDELPISYTII